MLVDALEAAAGSLHDGAAVCAAAGLPEEVWPQLVGELERLDLWPPTAEAEADTEPQAATEAQAEPQLPRADLPTATHAEAEPRTSQIGPQTTAAVQAEPPIAGPKSASALRSALCEPTAEPGPTERFPSPAIDDPVYRVLDQATSLQSAATVEAALAAADPEADARALWNAFRTRRDIARIAVRVGERRGARYLGRAQALRLLAVAIGQAPAPRDAAAACTRAGLDARVWPEVVHALLKAKLWPAPAAEGAAQPPTTTTTKTNPQTPATNAHHEPPTTCTNTHPHGPTRTPDSPLRLGPRRRAPHDHGVGPGAPHHRGPLRARGARAVAGRAHGPGFPGARWAVGVALELWLAALPQGGGREAGLRGDRACGRGVRGDRAGVGSLVWGRGHLREKERWVTTIERHGVPMASSHHEEQSEHRRVPMGASAALILMTLLLCSRCASPMPPNLDCLGLHRA